MIGGVEPEFDEDEKAVRKYAKENPMEDLEETEYVERSEVGGASANAQEAIQPDQSSEQHVMGDAEALARAKRQGDDVRLPIPVRQPGAETEAVKRSQQSEDDVQMKFVKFDPDTAVIEPSPKQQRTSLYSPVYAGDISGSPATSSTARHVRRIVEEIELYDDELECNIADDSFDWELCEHSVTLRVRR